MFTDCYCTQFRRSSNALTRIYDDALRPIGLRITQFSLMRALERLGASSATQLAEEVALERSTISRNAKILIDAGWIDVQGGDVDRRERVMSLNKAGRQKLKDALPYWSKAQKAVEKGTEIFVNPTSGDHQLLGALERLQDQAESLRHAA